MEFLLFFAICFIAGFVISKVMRNIRKSRKFEIQEMPDENPQQKAIDKIKDDWDEAISEDEIYDSNSGN